MKTSTCELAISKTIILLLLLSTAQIAFSQSIIITGQVTNIQGKPIPWVNIGIRNKNIGTISDGAGKFSISIPEQHKAESLTFSSVGFEEKTFAVLTLRQRSPLMIELRLKVAELAEVKISNKAPKIKKLGISGYTPFVWANLGTVKNGDIIEQGRLIKIDRPSQLLTANVNGYSMRNFKDSLTFRLNIYDYKDGKPGERLFDKSIVQTFDPAVEILSFDLSREDITLEKDFVIAFELLPKPNVIYPFMSFRAKLASPGGFARTSSLGTWNDMQGGSAVINVTVKQ